MQVTPNACHPLDASPSYVVHGRDRRRESRPIPALVVKPLGFGNMACLTQGALRDPGFRGGTPSAYGGVDPRWRRSLGGLVVLRHPLSLCATQCGSAPPNAVLRHPLQSPKRVLRAIALTDALPPRRDASSRSTTDGAGNVSGGQQWDTDGFRAPFVRHGTGFWH